MLPTPRLWSPGLVAAGGSWQSPCCDPVPTSATVRHRKLKRPVSSFHNRLPQSSPTVHLLLGARLSPQLPKATAIADVIYSGPAGTHLVPRPRAALRMQPPHNLPPTPQVRRWGRVARPEPLRAEGGPPGGGTRASADDWPALDLLPRG